MADIDTSFYPRADSNSLIDKIGSAMSVRNAMETNKLLQQQQTQGQLGIDASKIELAHKGYEGLGQLIGALAQDPRVATPEGPGIIQGYADNAVRLGYITKEQAATALQTMPQDPAQMGQWLQTLNTQHLDSAERFRQIYGTPGTITNGSQTLPVTTSSITGIRAIGAPIDQTLSPESRSEMMETIGPNGEKIMVPKGNMLTRAGMNPMTAQPLAAPQEGFNQLMPVERQPLGQPQMGDQVNGGVVTSPAAGQVEAQTKAATVSADRYATDAARETNYQQNILPIVESLRAVKALGPTGIGPGTEQLNELKSFMVSMGVPIPTEGLTNFDEANKYLSQMARSNGFTGSDAQLDAAQKASPSMKTSNGAAIGVLEKAMALTRLQNAQVRAFDQSGQGAQDYSKWANEWNAQQDPVAYKFDIMAPEDRVAYIKTLDNVGKDKLRASLTTAVKLGLVQPPSAE